MRATTDLDLVVSVKNQWAAFSDALAKRGVQPARTVGPTDPQDILPDIAVFRSSHARGTRVDVFIAKTAFEQAVIDSARRTDVLGTPVRLASPEAAIIYKLLAHRPRDLDDVESIFEARAVAGETLDWDFPTAGPQPGSSPIVSPRSAAVIAVDPSFRVRLSLLALLRDVGRTTLFLAVGVNSLRFTLRFTSERISAIQPLGHSNMVS